MRAYIVFFFTCCSYLFTSAQFYPNSNAIWCGWDDDGGPPGFDVQFLLGEGPDTLLQGNLYHKVQEFNNATGNWVRIRDYYVRSDITGVGYIYISDSLAEYPTGNISALVGDTVHDVLCIFPPGGLYYRYDFIVDSVVSISNSGVTVTRHFVHFDSPFAIAPNVLFWQAGMGTSFGPLVRLHGRPDYCAVDGVVQYNLGLNGLPGGPAWCPSFSVGIEEGAAFQHTSVSPNPSTGQFNFTTQLPMRISVYDALGRMVLQTVGKSVDLSGEPEVVYVAQFSSNATGNSAVGNSRQVVRLVVAR